MHVLGLNRTSGYNIPAAAAAAAATDGGVDGPPPPAARTTRIGRYEIVSKKDLKKHSPGKKGGGGAGASSPSSSSLALERWVCEFSPSFFSEGGREASVVTVLSPPEGEAAARQPGGPRKPGGVVVVSPVFPRGGGGGGGGGIAGAGRGATAATAAAATTTTGTKETTLSAGQTAVVHPGDTLFFPGCPRSLAGLRVLPGAAERDAQELERREIEEGKKKKKHAAAAAVAGKKRERAANATATAATAAAANSLPLRMQPEPLDRWHFSFLNARFAGRLEQRLRDLGASVSTLLPPSADAGTTGSLAEDAYLSLFPAAPLLIYGEDREAAEKEAAAAEVVAAEVRAARAPYFARAQVCLREAGLPPPPLSAAAAGGRAAAAARASAVVIGGEVKTSARGGGAAASTSSPSSSSPSSPAGRGRGAGAGAGRGKGGTKKTKKGAAAADAADDEFAEVCEIKVLRLAGLWPPPPGGWWAGKRNDDGGGGDSSAPPSSEGVSAAAALLPRSDFPVLLLPRTFVTDCLAASASASASASAGGPGGMPPPPPRIDASRLPLVAARFAAVAAAREARFLDKLHAFVSDLVCNLSRRGGGGARGGGAVDASELEFARRKLVLVKRAAGGACQLLREMEAWRDEEEEKAGELQPPAAGKRPRTSSPPPASSSAAARPGPASTLLAPPPPVVVPPMQPQQQQQQQHHPRARSPAAAPAASGAAAAAPVSPLLLLLPRGPLPPPGARTGGASGRPWGLGGVWLEPFSREGARRTCEAIAGNYRRPSSSRAARSAAAVSAAAMAAGGGGAGTRRAAAAAAAAAGAAAASDDDDDDSDDEGFHSDADSAPDLDWNGFDRPCHHVACSARAYCLVPPLEEARDNYDADDVNPRTVSFRKRALERCIAAVEACPFPLADERDVERFMAVFGASNSLAGKSHDKLLEVVESGDLRRNATFRADPRRVALRELTRVQGVGADKARDLVDELGCRSVRDLLEPPAWDRLTKQQRLGVEHFDDFRERVPRAEVAVVERAFRVAAAVVWKLALPAGGADEEESLLLPPPPPPPPSSSGSSFASSPSFLEVPGGSSGERAFVEAVGSYWRGTKADAGDIDILLSPAPTPTPSSSSSAPKTKGDLIRDLKAIIAKMRRMGFELEEGSMSSVKKKEKGAAAAAADEDGYCSSDSDDGGGFGGGGGDGTAHASFSGAIRCPARLLEAAGLPPSSARFRRIDVKIYLRRALPAALCYFSSGMNFSRQLRWWARADSAAARAALLPLAQQAARREFARSGRGPATTGEDPMQADSFHLSDKGLEVTRRGEPWTKMRATGKGTRKRNPQAFFSPSVFVPLSCETDIFEALGLEYVPPHMRDVG